MKKLLLLTVIAFATYHSVDAQKQKKHKSNKIDSITIVQKVYFDLNSPNTIVIPKKIKAGDFYQVQINDINLNNYKVIINHSDTVYSSPLTMPTIGTIDLSSVSEFTSIFKDIISVVGSGESEVQEIKSNEPNDVPSIFSKKMISNENLAYSLFYKKINNDDFRDNLTKNQAAGKKTDLTYIKIDTILSANQILIKNHEKRLAQINDSVENVNVKLLEYRIYSQTKQIKKLEHEEAIAYFDQLIDLQKSTSTIKEKSAEQLEKLNKFLNKPEIKLYLEIKKSKNSLLKEKAEKTEKAFITLNSKAISFDNKLSPSKIEKVIMSVLHIEKETEFTSLPIQFNGEQAKLDIQIIPKDSSSGLQAKYLAPIIFPRKKYYWSVGSSMYYSGLSDQRVSTSTIQVNDSVQKFVINEEEALDGEIGVAALLRGGGFLGRSGFGVHGTAGAALSIGKEVKPRCLAGFGISFGEKHSFVIDYGVIVGHVDKVSRNVTFGAELDEAPKALIKQLRWNKFVSVGYAYRF